MNRANRNTLLIAMMMVLSLSTLLSGCVPSEENDAGGDAGNTQDGTPIVRTGGSTSVEKVINALIYQFRADNNVVQVNYEMNGSTDGVNNTLSGLYEIGHSSRELKPEETGLTATAYAIDGMAVIVHPDNPVKNLTKEQLRGIFTGQITNWNQVGGSDALISLVSREEGSGARAAFADIVGLEKKGEDKKVDPSTAIRPDAIIANSGGAVQTQVASNPNAIGSLSFSEVDEKVVTMLQYEGVDLSEETLKDGRYGLKRNFYLLVKTDTPLSTAAQTFFDFILSEDGQQVVAQNHLIPVK